MRCRSANIKGLPGGGEEDDLGSLLRKLSSLAKHWKTRAGTADAGEVYWLKKTPPFFDWRRCSSLQWGTEGM